MDTRIALAALILLVMISSLACGPANVEPDEAPDPDPGVPAPKEPEAEADDPAQEEVPDDEEAGDEVPSFPDPGDVTDAFTVEDAFPGITFRQPLDLQHAPDGSGRLFVVEKGGRILVLDGPGATEAQVFLDITHLVDDSGFEMGLLGLAFHPGFEDNGYFYVNYTDDSDTVVARFAASGETADPETAHTVLRFDQPRRNHNGGQIAFGPDGYLYVATGDGGGSGDPLGHGQDRTTLHGNILRIDVDDTTPDHDYIIPADNPFHGNQEGYREEIYAYGLRNPWRFSFDPVTGHLWVADVGQDRVEEINLVEPGGNYGWNIMEGSLCFDPPEGCDPTGLQLPVYEYHHPLGRSITGGYVYRGRDLDLLEGAYVYGDYVTGLVWGLWYREGEELANHRLIDTGLRISSFGVDERGEIYLTAFDGHVYRITAP